MYVVLGVKQLYSIQDCPRMMDLFIGGQESVLQESVWQESVSQDSR